MQMRFSNMTDSMKFGPEWLRNLSSEGSTAGAPKYQLAEHRYGREEMLALFDRNVRAPDALVKIQGLYVEKTQIPMALLSMTEEETRQWNRGINSDAVLRLAGKTPLGLPGGLRGRGGSVDRGRGRSRGSGGFHYTRGLSYDETSEGLKDGALERGFSRGGRGYDRSQGGERGWPERNGGDSGDWNGSTSPRKEYSSSKDFSGRSGIDNWRRHRGSGEDEEGWRKSEKWGRSNSWRDEGDAGEGGGPKSTSRTSSWGRGWADEGIRGRRDDDDSSRRGFIDEVPEWAMENPSESGGSFDASGAFHGGNYSDEEEDNIGPRNSRNRLSDDPDSRNRSKSPPPVKKSIRHEYNDYDDEYDETNHSPKDRKLSRSQTAQGNLSESSSKPVPIPVSKSQSSSNIKSEPPESAAVSSTAKRTEFFDRIRVQHQNFVDKNSTNKEVSDSDELNDLNKTKKSMGEHNSVSENKLINSEADIVPEISNIRDKNSVLSKDSLNSNNNNNSAMKLAEDERDRGAPVNRQGSEEDMERMAEVVKDTVVKLFEDEEKPQVDNDKWYYRDPQGVVQGPFRSGEMLEWFVNGYFQLSLLVRRERDKVYVKLGDLMTKCGKVPFLPGVVLPTITPENEPPQPQLPQPPPPTPPTSVQPQPPNLTQSDLIMQQYHQYQLLQKQILLSHQLAINKLSQSEMWSTLSPAQQRTLLVQRLQAAQQQQQQPQPTLEQFAQMEKNPLSQLIAQMQQQQQAAKVQMPDAREIGSANNVDPIRQLLQQMNLLQPAQPPVMPTMNPSNVVFNHHLAQQVHLQNSVLNNPVLNPAPSLKVEENKAEDPIQSLLRQLGNQSKVMMQQSDTSDSLWGAPGRPQSWAQGTQPVGNPPNLPLWEIKTEQQILAEQQLRLEEERKQEELRKLQEQEEAAKRQRELEEKRREEEKKEELKKLELKRLEEEKARKQKEKEEKKKAEELKKKQQEELIKKKQEEIKKMEEAQRKKEEKERKKEEERERKRLLEEEKKRIELEKRKKEEEALRKKQEEEEEARRLEQQKRQMEALKRLQEQQMKSRIAPWSQSNITTGTSLADIQRLQEKEKKQLMREQQAIVQQMAHQNELQQMQREAESRSNGLNLKWAEQMPKTSHNVKSLAEIQAEEQKQLSKQQEKERLERLQQQRETSIPPTAGIWGAASQSLTWTNNNSPCSPWGVTLVQQNPSPGFWDEVAPVSSKNKTKTPSSPLKSKNPQPALNQKQGTNSGANQKATKTKPKKEEVAVLKLFEPLGDEFTSWCSAALQSLQTEVDIPTFVTFLRDVDSPYEVKDYVKLYLGEGKDAQEFAKQFLERRSRWRSAQKANIGEDDMNAPAQAINPNSQYQNVAQEFQEVKGKGKKNKKGKMLKVDSRILGFSVTSAPDRINVGDRDYVDHNL